METKEFFGIYPALLTPFDKNGKVNPTALKELVEFNLKKGVHGFYVAGSTGEGLLLSLEERKLVYKTVAHVASGKAKLIANVSAMNIYEAFDSATYAHSVGFDAISAVAPLYYGYSYEAVKTYYFDLANSTDLPVLIYNYPASSGFSLTDKNAGDFFDCEKFIGFKHTTSDFFTLERIKSVYPQKSAFNGYDEMLLSGLIAGADGGIGSTYNLMANRYVALYNAYKSGNINEAQALQKSCNDVIALLIKHGVMPCEKLVLTELGIDMGDCRKPFLPASAEAREAMKALAKTL